MQALWYWLSGVAMMGQPIPLRLSAMADHFSPFQRTRRGLLSLAALAVIPRGWAQTPPAIPLSGLHSYTLKVTDVARSIAFYQGLFGAGIQARLGGAVALRIGNGPHHFVLAPVAPGEAPGITRIGLAVPGFQPLTVQGWLTGHGITPSAAPSAGTDPLAFANRSWFPTGGPAGQPAPGDSPVLCFADADGLVYELSDPAYCGGGGVLSSVCAAVEPAPAPGRLTTVALSHFTNRVHNATQSNDYHKKLFGIEFQAYQGPNAPVIGTGDGIQFLMYIGGAGAGAPTRAGVIDHVCLSVTDFNVERILAILTDYGLTARADPANTPPLVHYVSLRLPNRGGAEGGTPELYFADPDGIRIQLQDPGYCGGTGYLGDDCSAPV